MSSGELERLTSKVAKLSGWKLAVWVGLFSLVLIGARMAWIASFQAADQPHAVNGELDLRNWEFSSTRALVLDGEWEFYPHMRWMEEERSAEAPGDSHATVQVPGPWNDAMQPDNPTPYGYGSYRLRIYVNPANEASYSIRVPSVRNASMLYINGRLHRTMGKLAETESEYAAYNVPYTATFLADGQGVIEVVVEAANYKDPRGGGIVRSLRFGTEEAVDRETKLSTSMQQLVTVVLMMHAVYAFFLYLLGRRERILLLVSLLAVSVMLLFMLSSEEKPLSFWFLINYEWGFKLVHLSMVGIAYALMNCIKNWAPRRWRTIYPGLGSVCAIATALALILPAHLLILIQPGYFLLTGGALFTAIVFMLRASVNNSRDNVYLLLAAIALTNNAVWTYVGMKIKVMYYPFDLIVATLCFMLVWFREYFRAHMEAKRMAAKLQEADIQKDRFLANTSHELRNPLHGILNMSQAVLDRERQWMDEKSVKDLGVVLTVGRRMSQMLDDLLDAVSLREGAPRLLPQRIALQAIVAGVMDMLQFMTERKPVRMDNRIPESFPLVWADENRVAQILFNLLHNALKFTEEGEVVVMAEVRGKLACIRVRDTGVGMDESTLQRVFEPYEQGQSGSRVFEGGFGLGLGISKQLVELHGGKLHATSRAGVGSEFVFTLPLAEDQTSSCASEREAHRLPATSRPLAASEAAAAREPAAIAEPEDTIGLRPRILVVDDDPVNLSVMESILSSENAELFLATNGKQALEALERQEWDLVIADVMMPRMSGYELARAIRGRFSVTELPILLLTARSRTEDIVNGFLSGANDYVTKPIEVLEFKARVRALTEVKLSAHERLQMEAAWLQAQIQPHFLFNTLNAVIALSDIDPERMRGLLEIVAEFLRSKFRLRQMNALAPIQEELQLVRTYLDIEQVRFEERLQVVWEVEECGDLQIPMLTIQPLVENAIRHGVMPKLGGGTVRIRVVRRDAHAEITVEDDGNGIEEEKQARVLDPRTKPEVGAGVGLLNTDRRLRRIYGQGLHIDSKPGQGTKVSFVVTKELEE
ncbi:ATP-binding response regulator [Cohnella fermenti]|uniref:histidine kinase n=1 Tax=Cohnella fermenti TaxID=2565925 RepID=A0A4S4C9H0_9BACL|nr:ATP-binding protein [Cohnella fermenti]THF84712.1 response regulator [Cohnella fermenti]